MPICSKDHNDGAVPKALGYFANFQGRRWRHERVACACELEGEAGIGTVEKLRAHVRDPGEGLRAPPVADQ